MNVLIDMSFFYTLILTFIFMYIDEEDDVGRGLYMKTWGKSEMILWGKRKRSTKERVRSAFIEDFSGINLLILYLQSALTSTGKLNC